MASVESSNEAWPCVALPRADLAGRTTLRVGGQAEWLLEPATPEEFQDAWRSVRERGRVPRLLGGGADLVIDDPAISAVHCRLLCTPRGLWKHENRPQCKCNKIHNSLQPRL